MTELEQYRREIDAIDGELVQLFLRRMEITGNVGRYKQERGIPVLDAGRERQVIAAKTALTDDPRPQGRRGRPLREHHGHFQTPAAHPGAGGRGGSWLCGLSRRPA